MHQKIKTTSYAFLAVVSASLLVINAYAVKTLDIFGSPLFFAAALLLEIILLTVLLHSLLVGLATPRRILQSIALSALRGAQSDPNIKKLTRSKSAILRWLVRRFHPGLPSGLPLTATAAFATIFFGGFIGVLKAVIFKTQLTRIDTRVINLVPSIRTNAQTTFFKFITFSANIETVVFVVFLAAILLWRRRQKQLAGLLLTTALLEEIGFGILKRLVGRARPDTSLSLIKETSFSFPSGHALRATVLFGLVAYLLYKSVKSSWAKLLVVITYITAVFLVAVSRIYLGVHYPSDVLASILFGGGLLVLAIGLIEIAAKFKIAGLSAEKLVNRTLPLVPLIAIGFVLLAAPVFVKIRSVAVPPRSITLSTISPDTVKSLPLYSETLTGRHMEPISFIYIGSSGQIETAFKSHGWYQSDPATFNNTLKTLAVGFQGGQYLSAPVTPSYLNAKPQNLAFEQPTAVNSLRQRHHTRLWQTNFALPDGRSIWVATASLDEGVEFAGAAKLPTHHINPNIDAERAYVVQTLTLNTNFIQVVQPQLGQNANGDAFFTDGRAAVAYLP